MNNGTQQPLFADLDAPMDSNILSVALHFIDSLEMPGAANADGALLDVDLALEQGQILVWILREQNGLKRLYAHIIFLSEQARGWCEAVHAWHLRHTQKRFTNKDVALLQQFYNHHLNRQASLLTSAS